MLFYVGKLTVISIFLRLEWEIYKYIYIYISVYVYVRIYLSILMFTGKFLFSKVVAVFMKWIR